jgi:cytidylyltransferase family
MLKRLAGIKDSSHMLPGHGGFFDRMDASLPVLPAATWIMLAILLF